MLLVVVVLFRCMGCGLNLVVKVRILLWVMWCGLKVLKWLIGKFLKVRVILGKFCGMIDCGCILW